MSDDGVGFGGADPGPGTGVGLTSIRSRADELGGRCAIRSGMTGTTVEAAPSAAALNPELARGTRPDRRRELRRSGIDPTGWSGGVRCGVPIAGSASSARSAVAPSGTPCAARCIPCSTAATPATIADAALVPPKPFV